jgi:hypothetical protein
MNGFYSLLIIRFFNTKQLLNYYYYYYYSALGPVWAGTRAQSGDRYGSGTLHPGQVLRGSLPLLDAERKLIHIIHIKAFLFELDNALSLKYINILFSHKLLHVM